MESAPHTKSFSAFEEKKKHLEPLRNCSTKWCWKGRSGKGHGSEGCRQSLLSGGIRVSDLCALGKWSPHFQTSQTRPFHMVQGKRRERGYRAEKAAEFFPRSDLGTQGFTYIDVGQETQSQQDHQSYHHSIRVRPQQKGFTQTKWATRFMPITGGLAPEYTGAP